MHCFGAGFCGHVFYICHAEGICVGLGKCEFGSLGWGVGVLEFCGIRCKFIAIKKLESIAAIACQHRQH